MKNKARILCLCVLIGAYSVSAFCAGLSSSVVPAADRISESRARLDLAGLLARDPLTRTQALTQYAEVLKNDPHNPDALEGKARVLYWLGEYQESLAALSLLKSLGAGGDRLDLLRAEVLSATGQNRLALDLVDRLLKAKPGDPGLLLKKAILLARTGQGKQSAALFEGLLSSSSDPSIELAYADSALAWGDYYQTIRTYEKYLRTHPADIPARLKLAQALNSAQRHEEAYGVLAGVLRDDPGNAQALELMARTAMLEKDFARAARIYSQIAGTRKSDSKLQLQQARALYLDGEYGRACSILEDLAGSPLASEQVFLAYGKCLQRAGDLKGAGKAFQKAHELSPRAIEPRYLLAGKDRVLSRDFLDKLLAGTGSAKELADWGDVYLRNNHLAQAVACYKKALDLAPDSVPIQMDLAQALASGRDYKGSLELLERMEAEHPGNAKILLTKARVLSWDRQYQAALEAYENLSNLDPADPVPVREMARVAYWDKNDKLGSAYYEKLYTSSGLPGETRTDHAGGEPYAAHEDSLVDDSGVPVFAQDRPDAADNYGRYLIQKRAFLEHRAKSRAFNGQNLQALDSYEQLLTAQPGNEEALFDLAQTQCGLNLLSGQIETYERLQRIDPLHALSARSLARARRRTNPAIRAGWNYWYENGYGDLSKIERNRGDAGVDVPVYRDYHIRLTTHYWLDAPLDQATSYSAFGQTIAFGGVVNEHLKGEVSWTNKRYQDSGLDDSNTGRAVIGITPVDRLDLSLGYERLDEIYNDYSIRQGIQSNNVFVSAFSQVTRRVDARARVLFKDYSDNNFMDLEEASVGYAFTDHPRILKASLWGEHRNTAHSPVYHYKGNNLQDITHPYWAPQDYYAGAVIMEWRHDLSAEQVCGAPLHYYSITASAGTATDGNNGMGLEAKWHYEFLEHWMVNVSGLIRRTEKWNATGGWLNLEYRF